MKKYLILVFDGVTPIRPRGTMAAFLPQFNPWSSFLFISHRPSKFLLFPLLSLPIFVPFFLFA